MLKQTLFRINGKPQGPTARAVKQPGLEDWTLLSLTRTRRLRCKTAKEKKKKDSYFQGIEGTTY